MNNKVMKHSKLVMIFTLICGNLLAQTSIDKRLPAREGDLVNLEFKFANRVEVSTWQQSEVEVVVQVVSQDETFIQGYTVAAVRDGQTLGFSSNSEELMKSLHTEEDCCYCCGQGMEINVQLRMPAGLDLQFNSITADIEVPVMTGQLDLKTISGDIAVKPGGKMRLHSISGDVELLIDEPLDAEFSAKTISGEIFSNLEFEYLDGVDGLRLLAGQKVRGRLNNGGKLWDLETISGNIFLRQL